MTVENSDLVIAAADLVGRTGASQFMVRYSDEEKPVVWMCLAGYNNPKGNAARGTDVIWQVGAGMTPEQAALHLLDALVDGGRCTHCERPTGVSENIHEMPLSGHVCWYQFDPELKIFRRGCEGKGN